MKVWYKSVGWHVSRLPGPLVDRLLSLVINYSSRFVQYPHYPIACCLPHCTSTVASAVAPNCTLTSQQKEKDSTAKIFLPWVFFFLLWGYSFCGEVILFAVRFFFSVCHEVILFAVRFFFLPWGYSFCRKVFLFAVRLFFLPWGFSFCREVFLFAVMLILLPWQLWATVLPTFKILFPKILDFSTCGYCGVRTSTNFAYLTSF